MAKKKASKSKKAQSSVSQLLILFLLFLATVGVLFVAVKDKNEKEMAAVEGAATRSAEIKKPPCLSFGDVNGDGVTDEKDATEITRKIQGLRPAKKYLYQNADLDGDKRVTTKDKELIQKYAQKKITTLPVCPPKGKKCTSASDCSTGGTCAKGYCVPQRPFPTKIPITKYPVKTAPVQ